MVIADLAVAVVLAVFVIAAMVSLALAKHPFAAQLIVVFVVVMVYWVVMLQMLIFECV